MNQAIVSTSTGYHVFERRQVALSIVSGTLQVQEGGRTTTITRAEALPIEWVGEGRSAPMVPLAGLVLDAPGGPWVVSTTDTTIVLADSTQQASPAPHVWVSGEDLAGMAAACNIEVTRREAWMPPPGMSRKNLLILLAGFVAFGVFLTVMFVMGWATPYKGRSTESCDKQRPPQEELYPRLSCKDARTELDKVSRGEATPRAIVLRANSLTVDARDVEGPGTITCDGLQFAVVDAKQAAPEPIVFSDGPNSILVEEQTDGTLRVSQYCLCCNVVGRERRGPKP